MGYFSISGQLKQFCDDTADTGFVLAGDLPQFTGSIVINNLDFDIAGELKQFDGAIEVAHGQSFAVSGTLPQFGGSIGVIHGRVFAIAGTLNQFAGNITVSSERQFAIGGTLKQFTGSIITHVTSDFSIVGALNQFVGSINFAGTFTAIAMNVSHCGVTNFANYPFNSLIEHEGEFYGITATGGIYILTGSDDAGTDIDAFMDSGSIDFGDGKLSMIEDAWALARTPGSMALTLYADDDATGDTYTDTGDPAGKLATLRFEPDKGVEGNTWRYRLANVDGSNLSVQQARFLVSKLSRNRQ